MLDFPVEHLNNKKPCFDQCVLKLNVRQYLLSVKQVISYSSASILLKFLDKTSKCSNIVIK